MFSIGVYVTSRYKNYEEFKVTLDEALKKYIPTGRPNALCTGSSKSNNAGNGLVKRYAFENNIPCRVFETQWANNIPTKPGKKNTAGVRANAMIIRNSNACIMFWSPTAIARWDFMSGGCYNFQKMCGKMQRELIPIKVDIYKPIDTASEEEMPQSTAEQGIEGLESNPSVGVGGEGGGHLGDGIGSPRPSPSVGGGDAPAAVSNSPLMPRINLPKSGSGISEIPVDINGDGTPDANVVGMDTTGDGTPDSILTPVDADSNGTVDGVELSPLPSDVSTETPASNAIAPSTPNDVVPQQTTTPTPSPQTSLQTAEQPPEEDTGSQS